MKKLFFLLILTLFALPVFAANKIEVVAKVTDVTVYNDRALTKRAATVQLKPGLNLVTIKNLPLLLQDDSVTIEGHGVADVTISGVSTDRQFLEQATEQRLRELQNKINSLEHELAALEAGKSGTLAQKEFVSSLKNSWAEWLAKRPAAGAFPTAELKEMMQFVGGNITRLDQESYNIETKQQKLRDNIAVLKRELAATDNDSKDKKQVELALETINGGSFTLQLAAVTAKAGWKPVYDLHLNADGKTVQLAYRAMVTQKTGEDWENVRLHLSTANPARGGAPPILYPWHISFSKPLKAMNMAMAAAPMARKALPLDSADALVIENSAVYQTATTEQGLTSSSFQIDTPVSIAADGSGHNTVIAIRNLAVQPAYQVVPKLAQFAWLTAELLNNSDYPLLSGEARIYTDNSFIGTAMLKKTAIGEKTTLPFGVDEQILVKYESKKEHQEAGFLSNNRVFYHNKIDVENLHKEIATIEVKDQLPLAENAEIKVSLAASSVKPEQIKDDGEVIWKLALQPGEKQEINFTVLLDYPAGREVSFHP